MTYFLPKKHTFVLFNLLFDCRQVGNLLVDLFYLWCLLILTFEFKFKSQYTVKKFPKLDWKLDTIFTVWKSKNLPSISSTLNAQILHTYESAFRQLFLLTYNAKKMVVQKNRHIKCWWNWHLVGIKIQDNCLKISIRDQLYSKFSFQL